MSIFSYSQIRPCEGASKLKMSSPVPASQVRNRKDKKRATTPNPDSVPESDNDVLAKAKLAANPSKSSEWDYKIALAIITVLAFVTRFWKITHPNEVVFDEVHFGKVRCNAYPPLLELCQKSNGSKP
jgi:dolichyl-phosphate-mannose-protein mannosyltransferase